MTATIYLKDSGQILRTVQCQASDIGLQYDAETQNYIEGSYPDDQFYIGDGAPVAIPTQPSPVHVFNWVTKQWEDPRTLQDFKEAQWTLIKQARTNAEYAGFTWDGSTFDSDATSQQRITGAVSLAQMSTEFTIGWTLQDNTVRVLNQGDMLNVGIALGLHVATQFAKAQALRLQIDAAVSQTEIEALVW